MSDMTKQYLITQINRIYKMISDTQHIINKELLKQGQKIDIKMITDLGEIAYKYNKNKSLESATKQALLNILDEYVEYGFKNNISGFDKNFKY